MNIQKSRLAAMLTAMLMVCTMVCMLAVPASAATIPVVVNALLESPARVAASFYEYMNIDLQGQETYLNLAVSLGISNSPYPGVAFVSGTRDYLYVSEGALNNSLKKYNDAYGTNLTFNNPTNAYYTNVSGVVFYKLKYDCSGLNHMEATATFHYCTSSAFVNAIPDNSLNTVLNQIIDLLPVVIPVLIGFIGLHKAVQFLIGVLHGA